MMVKVKTSGSLLFMEKEMALAKPTTSLTTQAYLYVMMAQPQV